MGAHGRIQDGTETALQHARLAELLAAFADGELAEEDRRAVEEHLRECARCRRELTLQRDLSRALSREPIPGASANLRRRIEWMGEPRRPRSSGA